MNPPPPPSILATAVIPWTADFTFDEATFRREVHAIAEEITRTIYIFGTAGEGYAVTDQQFATIARVFHAVAQECDVTPILGIISLSLPAIIARIQVGHAIGFREFQISLPGWGALNDTELDTFFAHTCGAFPDCRFHHYNLARTKRILTGRDYLRLAAAHPNLVAVKASTDDEAVVADLLTVSPRLRFYFTEFGYEIARRTHEVGLLLALSSVNYARAHAFVNGDNAQRAADILCLRQLLQSLIELSGGRFHIDGAFDKMLYRINDPTFPLRLLPPYATATNADFEKFRGLAAEAWS
ncbi:dihydrodipicolinate synthase family protein [Synoicihabitans lomoniglobus]|uniref:Dihydrodipicolinate synthase family protein n=1 Tax=Synoicihabitans lomoniglobus TaxID=2909285 RepID=A0AAE9ZR52_9BACT|nr:dihydrodipicolinate synthase family protein [Opitutaceae bacterium LMO-M01]WED63690.1 dihydrodipicolinate synthase family protein [Opitutaceae bacterium LMO-M01]